VPSFIGTPASLLRYRVLQRLNLGIGENPRTSENILYCLLSFFLFARHGIFLSNGHTRSLPLEKVASAVFTGGNLDHCI
jgi:hypothetical protein